MNQLPKNIIYTKIEILSQKGTMICVINEMAEMEKKLVKRCVNVTYQLTPIS